MNMLSRKLHQLEENILDFPPEDDDIMLHIGDVDERLLHDRARQIRATLEDEVQAIINSGTSIEKQNQSAKQLLSRLSDQENAILEQSLEFLSYRLERLVYKWFAVAYPKGEDARAMLRVLWFFREMKKLNHACVIEDFEWTNNRNEDDPNFDDFAWWETVDAKIRAIYPEGVFTEKSFEEFERLDDEFLARKVKEYYEKHPEEWTALVNNSGKEMEAEKNSE